MAYLASLLRLPPVGLEIQEARADLQPRSIRCAGVDLKTDFIVLLHKIDHAAPGGESF